MANFHLSSFPMQARGYGFFNTTDPRFGIHLGFTVCSFVSSLVCYCYYYFLVLTGQASTTPPTIGNLPLSFTIQLFFFSHKIKIRFGIYLGFTVCSFVSSLVCYCYYYFLVLTGQASTTPPTIGNLPLSFTIQLFFPIRSRFRILNNFADPRLRLI